MTARRMAYAAAAAGAVVLTCTACNPTITATATCRGDTPFITVALGQADSSYPYPDDLIHVAIGAQDNAAAAAVADELGSVHPGGEVSSTVPRSGATKVVVTWPDGTTTESTVTAPECPGGGR